ncbi:MAG TPA: hypothetical protein VEO54_23490 [Thermoanaerobaculia bacterium]|nr:hypothetical protein [Thermoanaerobaculia bacterium]
MKRILTIVLALGLGGAASADDAAKKPAAEATAAPAPVVTASDSPMVAAAKRANRKGRKATTIVITNETLNKSGAGAHVTTTAKQPAFATSKEPVRPTPEMLHQQQREAEKRRQAAEAAKQQKAAETKEQAAAAAAAAAEEGLYDAEELEPQETQKPPRF